MLELIERVTQPGARTLETGAGYSTVVFAARGAAHTAVQPDQLQVDEILRFMREHGVSDERLDFVVAGSERALPRMDAPLSLDVALIDGLHGFPAPLIDWTYIAPMLKVGGTLIVDDTDIWTGRVLRDFLLAEADWQLLEELTPRASAFTKTDESAGMKEWFDQPYVTTLTRGMRRRFVVLRAAQLAAKGDIRGISTRIRRRLR